MQELYRDVSGRGSCCMTTLFYATITTECSKAIAKL